MAIVALVFAVLISTACDPGPLPPVPTRQDGNDYKRDWFPSKSYDPLPLDIAIHNGNFDEARRLLESGADPNARWSQSGDRFPIQEVLESRGFGYHIDDPVAMIALLLKHGADPNMKWCPYESRGPHDLRRPGCTSATGMTPLMYASHIQSRPIVEMLLVAGADATQRHWGRVSALDYAYDEIIFEMISRALFSDIATRDELALAWVSQSDGGPYSYSFWSETPVTRALIHSEGGSYLPASADLETQTISRLRTLLRIGADPNQRLTQVRVDWTALFLALSSNRLRSARVLLENDADVNVRWCTQFELRHKKLVPMTAAGCSMATGMTPLMLASKNNFEAVRLLFEFKADRSLRDWSGQSAFDYAATPAIRELLKH